MREDPFVGGVGGVSNCKWICGCGGGNGGSWGCGESPLRLGRGLEKGEKSEGGGGCKW